MKPEVDDDFFDQRRFLSFPFSPWIPTNPTSHLKFLLLPLSFPHIPFSFFHLKWSPPWFFLLPLLQLLPLFSPISPNPLPFFPPIVDFCLMGFSTFVLFKPLLLLLGILSLLPFFFFFFFVSFLFAFTAAPFIIFDFWSLMGSVYIRHCFQAQFFLLCSDIAVRTSNMSSNLSF